MLGHDLLVTTKDDYVIYAGRVNPNWTRVVLGQGGYAAKYIGKKVLHKNSRNT
ncbi:hypothetical protein [Saccharolobus islandicus]|uniref:Uncharacterized protein n=3 Tax=Saccharolobus islandicus TaxID=43080 RepID=M9UG61_SACIS|nr:hypothetical protein [Sulfolobus islandicus]ADX83207.1 hypothetical protein SiH_1859 [Sulfolobus islandicus HVE10/4]ADX85843.1 hypothetical protein SiRe_1779 [Sulfolobus islandicus REY15A]AGJ63220.1 Hypothetical Protein SiL_1774 [Sulfolobus islandicus LAL14/1]